VALAVLVLLTGCDRLVRVSVDAAGGDPNGHSGSYGGGVRGGIALDGTGTVVVFESEATDLLPGGNARGLFVRDLAEGSIERIGNGGTPDITADGRYVAYTDYGSGSSEVQVHDRVTGTSTLVSVTPDGQPAEANSHHPSISDDGRYVVWESWSNELVPGYGNYNIFIRDLEEETTDVVSQAVAGGQADETSHTPVISGDGRFVAFSSWATDMTVGDTPTNYREVFIRDLEAGVTEKVSLDENGVPISFAALVPSISDDGRFVAFQGSGSVYVRDVVANQTEAASVFAADGQRGQGQLPAISGDGRMVVFTSGAALSSQDTNAHNDVYVRDRSRGTTTRVSVDAFSQQSPGDPSEPVRESPAISDNGHQSAFATESPLIAGDANNLRDVYLRAALRPLVSSVSPSTVSRGTTATLLVTGADFLDNASAGVDLPGSRGVHVTAVAVLSSSELRVEVSVDADAAVGSRTLLVTNRTAEPGNPASTVGACTACLLVE
jgi:Tol biopolymer transport system component